MLPSDPPENSPSMKTPVEKLTFLLKASDVNLKSKVVEDIDMFWGKVTQIGRPSGIAVKYQSENVRRKTIHADAEEKTV